MVHLHGGHVMHMDRHAVVRGDDDVSDFLNVGCQAKALHQQRFAGAHYLAAADILVVGLQGLKELFEREPVFDQPFRLRHDVVLLLIPAPAINLRHAGHFAQLGLDHPILQFADFRQGALSALRCFTKNFTASSFMLPPSHS